jgi:hypothetical protein
MTVPLRARWMDDGPVRRQIGGGSAASSEAPGAQSRYGCTCTLGERVALRLAELRRVRFVRTKPPALAW